MADDAKREKTIMMKMTMTIEQKNGQKAAFCWKASAKQE